MIQGINDNMQYIENLLNSGENKRGSIRLLIAARPSSGIDGWIVMSIWKNREFVVSFLDNRGGISEAEFYEDIHDALADYDSREVY